MACVSIVMADENSTEKFPVGQTSGFLPKTLSNEEKQKLQNDTALVTPFKQNKLELEARKNWDLFYKRNSTKFFKDRHWTDREFEELCFSSNGNEKKTLLEVGCGVGNAIFPILKEHSNVFVYCCDFSSRAVNFVKENPEYDSDRCHAFECDLTKDKLVSTIQPNTVDIITIIFVLSAILPSKMRDALSNMLEVLKAGGVVLFRDYGIYDHAMLRFSRGHKLDECLYVRQDGTRAYYFSTDKIEELFTSIGFEVIENEYIYRKTVNKKENIDVPRIFVQGKFRKKST